jgi:hypothetical protein
MLTFFADFAEHLSWPRTAFAGAWRSRLELEWAGIWAGGHLVQGAATELTWRGLSAVSGSCSSRVFTRLEGVVKFDAVHAFHGAELRFGGLFFHLDGYWRSKWWSWVHSTSKCLQTGQDFLTGESLLIFWCLLNFLLLPCGENDDVGLGIFIVRLPVAKRT